MNDFYEFLKSRQSCRSFDTKPVEIEKIIECVRAASIAPSACNSQPWSFIAVKKEELCKQLAPLLQEDGFNRFTDRCPAFIVVREEVAILFNGATGESRENQHFASLDTGLAVMQLCLQATALGLSTCIMGSFNEQKVKALLNLSDEKPVRLVIGIGYAQDGKLRKKQRKEVEQILEIME